MLSTPNISFRSLSFSSIITCILNHFRVPISEPSHDEPRELGDEDIASLSFIWESGQWVKDQNLVNKPTKLAPFDDRIFNDVLPPDKLPDLSASL